MYFHSAADRHVNSSYPGLLIQVQVKTGLAVNVPDLGLHRIKSAASITKVTDIRVERYNKVQLKPEDGCDEGHFAKVTLDLNLMCIIPMNALRRMAHTHVN
jgi:hypothetical protein